MHKVESSVGPIDTPGCRRQFPSLGNRLPFGLSAFRPFGLASVSQVRWNIRVISDPRFVSHSWFAYAKGTFNETHCHSPYDDRNTDLALITGYAIFYIPFDNHSRVASDAILARPFVLIFRGERYFLENAFKERDLEQFEERVHLEAAYPRIRKESVLERTIVWKKKKRKKSNNK